MGRLVLLTANMAVMIALLMPVVKAASVEDRAVEALRMVSVSDRALDDWWKTFDNMWTRYNQRKSAEPNRVCTDHEALLAELGRLKTQIGLVGQAVKAMKDQLTQIRDILEHAVLGTKSGLHCQKTPEEPICKALQALDEALDQKQERLDGEVKAVNDEIKRVTEYDCNCTWAPWKDAWEECSVSCEKGTKKERRGKLWEKRNNGQECNSKDAVRTAPCNEGCCPVNCQWGPWEPYTDCPNICQADPVYKQRTREKAQSMECQERGGKPCEGAATEKLECKPLDIWNAKIEKLKTKHDNLVKQVQLYKEKMCEPNPCANGASCNEGVCTCAGGWQGVHCKTKPRPKPAPEPEEQR